MTLQLVFLQLVFLQRMIGLNIIYFIMKMDLTTQRSNLCHLKNTCTHTITQDSNIQKIQIEGDYMHNIFQV